MTFPKKFSQPLLVNFPSYRKAALLVVLFSGLLAACASGPPNLSWPGLAVQGDVAYLAYNHIISAVNLSTGEMIWKFPPKTDAANTYLFYSNPNVDSKGQLAAGSYDGSVVLLNGTTGDLLWTHAGDKRKIIAPVAEGPDGTLYASSENGNLLMIDPADGSTRQSISLDQGSTWGTMAVDTDHIYVATVEHQLYAIRTKDGVQEWKKDLEAPVAGGISLAEGKIFVGTFTNKVLAIDAATGDTIWQIQTEGWVWQPPTVVSGVAYVADLGGSLRAITVADGTVRWKVSLDGPSQTAPVVANDIVYVGMQSGAVRALSATDGTPKWEKKLEGGVFGSMVLAGNRLLLTVTGGKYQLAALSIESGDILWSYSQPTE